MKNLNPILRTVCCACLAYGGIFAISIGAAFNSRPNARLTPDSGSKGKYDLQRGEFLFKRSCSVCHSLNPIEIGGAGPNLSNIGALGGTRRPGMSATAYIVESIMDPDAFRAPGVQGEMPKNLNVGATDQLFRELVAFLSLQGGRIDEQELEKVVIPKSLGETPAVRSFDRTQVEAGRALFLGKASCITCHSFSQDAESISLGPNLFFAGYTSKEELLDAILNPAATFAPGYEYMSLGLKSGDSISGRLVSRDHNGISIITSNADGVAELSHFPSESLSGEAPIIFSPMPTIYKDLLSAEELEAIVTFITALN